MNMHSPKYVPHQIISVRGKLYLIKKEGVLDGGEFWYGCREYEYDCDLNLITWGSFKNIPEEDIDFALNNIVPASARNHYR